MLDPRNGIVSLFSNSRIGATTEYGTRYVSVELREDNENATLSHDNTGVILLEKPDITSHVIKIDGKTTEDVATILANMWIKKEKGMKNPDEFVNSILDTFQNEIIDHHLDPDSTTRVITFDGVVNVPSESPELIRKTIMLTACGYKIRS